MSRGEPHSTPDPRPGDSPVDRSEYSQASEAPSTDFSALLDGARLFFAAGSLPEASEVLLALCLGRRGFRARRAGIFLLDEAHRRLVGYHALERDRTPEDPWEALRASRPSLDPSKGHAQDAPRDLLLEGDAARSIRRIVFEMDGGGPHIEALRQGRSLFLERSDSEDTLDPSLRALFPDELLVLCPFAGREGPLGLCILSGDPLPAAERGPWLGALEAAAALFAASVLLLRLRERGARHVRLLEAVRSAAYGAVTANRLESILRGLAHAGVDHIGAATAAVWVREAEGLRLVASVGSGAIGPLETFERLLPQVEECVRERRGIRRGGDGAGGAGFLCVPMISFDETIGALALLRRRPDGILDALAFTPEDQVVLETLAALGASAIRSARLHREARSCGRKLEQAERSLLQAEKLAALGEMSVKVAHEIRSPLSAIGGFARRIEKSLPEGDPNRSYASIILREIGRLETILDEQLQFAGEERPRMTIVDVSGLLRETVLLVREEAERKGVDLLEQSPGGLPRILIDRDRIKQVLLNILRNALESTGRGRKIRIRSRASEGWIQIEIANDGERMPGDALDQLFVPFSSPGSGGNGLGLAVADQIVREHGGEIRVRAGEEWSVVFTVSLPIRANADRRQKLNRRSGRDRRRVA